MNAITTVEQIKNISGKVYVRWSKSITLDNKRGYSLRYGRQAEAGLSACELDKTWEAWRIIRQIQEYKFLGGFCWIVSGDEIGLGGDNEPLLKNVECIGKVGKDLLTANWRKMELETKISDSKRSLAKITNESGYKIVSDSIKKYEIELGKMA